MPLDATVRVWSAHWQIHLSLAQFILEIDYLIGQTSTWANFLSSTDNLTEINLGKQLNCPSHWSSCLVRGGIEWVCNTAK